jgi:hypothetical protein
MEMQLLHIICHFSTENWTQMLQKAKQYIATVTENMTNTVKRDIVILCSNIMLVSIQSIEIQNYTIVPQTLCIEIGVYFFMVYCVISSKLDVCFKMLVSYSAKCLDTHKNGIFELLFKFMPKYQQNKNQVSLSE